METGERRRASDARYRAAMPCGKVVIWMIVGKVAASAPGAA